MSGSIPRFLLPQGGSIWRSRLTIPTSPSLTIRHASGKAPKKSSKPSTPYKPLVLEKPTKFNPPSHGARLRKEAPRYPGPQLSAEEAARQKTKKYPNLMPPKGTFMHWFIHNKSIHLWITLGTLFTLASTVFITNFKNTSPFAEMLPHWSQLFLHPIAFTRTWVEVLRLDTARTTAETQERRKQKVEDVAKRAAYRKAHGLDKDEGFGGWTAKSDAEALGPSIPIEDAEAATVVADAEAGSSSEEEPVGSQEPRQRKPLKKWLGIW